MTQQLIEQIRQVTDTPYQNNSRSIAINKVDRFLKSPSENNAQVIEQMFGLQVDWSDADHGEGPKQ